MKKTLRKILKLFEKEKVTTLSISKKTDASRRIRIVTKWNLRRKERIERIEENKKAAYLGMWKDTRNESYISALCKIGQADLLAYRDSFRQQERQLNSFKTRLGL